jgi:hypothetical protein
MVEDIGSSYQDVSTCFPIHHGLLIIRCSSLSSLVAGNHDVRRYHECSVLLLFLKGDAQLCLDTKWGESDNWGFSPEVSPIKFNLPYGSSDAPRKVIQRARAYVHSQASFGMFYLEHRPIHVTSPTGRVWKLYGSPVSSQSLMERFRDQKCCQAAPVYVEGAFQYASRTEAKGMLYIVAGEASGLISSSNI